MPVREVYVKARPDVALRRDRVIKWVMLLSASIAFILGLIACYTYVNIVINAPASTYGGTGFDFFCEHGPCGAPTSHPPAPSYFPATIFALGYGLFSFIAFLVGLGHAIAHHAWRWVGYFLSPPLLLLISLVFLLLTFNPLSFSLSGLVSLLVFLLLFAVVVFLIPVGGLAYAILLDNDE